MHHFVYILHIYPITMVAKCGISLWVIGYIKVVGKAQGLL